jgi:small conductance mechanosensitive channel
VFTPDTILDWVVVIALRLALAWGVVIGGRYLARHARSATQKLVARPDVLKVVSTTIGRLLCNIVYYGLFGAAIGLALIVLGVPATYVLTVSSVVFILAALALRESLSNLAATVIFLTFQPFYQGEIIETMGHTGTVQEIQLFNTVLLTVDQRFVSLANSEIQTSGVINYTRTGIVRNQAAVTVGYQANLEDAHRVIQEIISQDHRILADPPPIIAIQELTEIGVRLVIYCMSASVDGAAVTSDLRAQIKARFDTESIPFAQREIHLTSK